MNDIIDSFPRRLHKMTQLFCEEVPSQVQTRAFVDKLVNTLFLVRDDKNMTLRQIEARWEALQFELEAILRPLCAEHEFTSRELMEKFFTEIPVLYTQLLKDADLYATCDPASYCKEEIILCYPGFYAVTVYRLAHVLYRLKVPILPRVISEYAHSQTGIDIHPGATIGPNFYIDHGTGIVIGETTVIGRNVKIYQGVTLGSQYVDKGLSGSKRHPTIEDNVIIYAGSTILGGETVIGHDTGVGGNVWLTESVPPDSVVYHKPSIVIKDSKLKQGL